MELAAILSLATAFVNLVSKLIDRFLPEKQMPTFKKANKIGAAWTAEKIQSFGRKRGWVE